VRHLGGNGGKAAEEMPAMEGAAEARVRQGCVASCGLRVVAKVEVRRWE
jgi:hypothetical protein